VTLDDLRACSRDFPLDPKVKVVVLPTEDETTDAAVTLADGVAAGVTNGVAAN
jgi:hypothetical protein